MVSEKSTLKDQQNLQHSKERTVVLYEVLFDMNGTFEDKTVNRVAPYRVSEP